MQRRTLVTNATNNTDNGVEEYDYDYLVIGSGWGGIVLTQRAAKYGAKVAMVESGWLGGMCVIVG